jgi:hypothetical protein
MPVRITRSSLFLSASCAALFAALLQTAAAATLCVDPSGGGGCYTKIQTAVNHAAAYDVINVKKGTYYEDVTIGIPLSLIGAGAHQSVINADGLANGIFVDGFDHAGLHAVTIAGFTIENALYEAVLVVSAFDVTVRDNTMINNDKYGPVFNPASPNCVGQPSFQTDESGDCGGALHFIGTSNSIASGNLMTGNADGILISDETAESTGNLIVHNVVKNNPLDCGIVLASHAPVGSSPPYYAAHYGVDNNTVADNISKNNGVQVGGAGVGIFSDGNGPGRASGNVIIGNTLTGNGIGGVSLHTHVGPSFHAPADNMSGNSIIGNTISGNLADSFDTATPGRVGININSGDGGSPVLGTVITGNTISDEDVDIAINTPALVDIHLNNLLGGKIGVADVCVFDGATACTGSIDAIQNYWGCDDGPGAKKCSTVSGADLRYIPWLQDPVTDDPDTDQ